MHDNFPDSETATDDGAGAAGEPHERGSEAPTDDGVIVIAGKRYLTLQTFARRFKRCDRTAQRWIEKRVAPPCIKIGNLRLIDEEKIPEWLEGLEIGPLPERRRRSKRGA